MTRSGSIHILYMVCFRQIEILLRLVLKILKICTMAYGNFTEP